MQRVLSSGYIRPLWLFLTLVMMVIQRDDPMGLSSLPWILSSRVPQKTLAVFAAAIAAWTRRYSPLRFPAKIVDGQDGFPMIHPP